MKKALLVALAALTLAVPAMARSYRSHGSHRHSYSGGIVHVHGYWRHNHNGTMTYVHPYDRTAPNGTQTDNWSTLGNQNPETGKWGTKRATH